MKTKVEIICGFLSGSSTEDEMLLFNELMKQEENNLLFEQIKKIWNESPNVKNYKEYDTKRAFYELSKRIEANKNHRKRFIISTISGIAAGILLLIGLLGLIKLQEDDFQKTTLFKTEAGNRSELTLPDGTKVWLNSRTELSYEPDFGKSNRNISISGEAYFDVTRSNKPFIVDVKDLKIQVYGTKFNISAYSDDNFIQTSLESGQISIKKEGQKELIVKPGQLIVYERNTSTFHAGMVDTENYSSWRHNKMYLNNEPIAKLAKKLERKYNVKILFVPESLGENIHYSGIFTNENIIEVLDAISIASGLKYSKNDNMYSIKKK